MWISYGKTVSLPLDPSDQRQSLVQCIVLNTIIGRDNDMRETPKVYSTKDYFKE